MPAADWPDPASADELYRRVLANDPLAPSDFAVAVLEPLIAYLRFKWPHADDHDRQHAAEDAVLEVIRKPPSYHPELRSLRSHLQDAAHRDMINLDVKERRHHRGRDAEFRVELASDGGNDSADDGLPAFDDPRLAAVIAGFTHEERRAFDLMRDGERRTAAFAEALGFAERPTDEQEREAKRAKDRIVKRLKRAVEEP